MTRHVQQPRETLYAESVCGENAIHTGGTWSLALADCGPCIAIYDREHGVGPDEPSGDHQIRSTVA